jgi:hypothetical protein
MVQLVDGLESLILPFTHDEIDKIVHSMPSNKASSPDAYNGKIIKSCWHIIKMDFLLMSGIIYGILDSGLRIVGDELMHLKMIN